MRPTYSHTATLIVRAELAPHDDDIVRYFRRNRKHMLITEFGMLHVCYNLTFTDIFTLHFRFSDEREELFFEKDNQYMTYLYSILKQGRLKVKRFKHKAVIDIEYVSLEDRLL